MIGEDEATVETAAPAHAAEHHPPRGRGGGGRTEEAQPSASRRRRRGDDQGPSMPHAPCAGGHTVDRRQAHAAVAVGPHELRHGAVGHDRTDRRIDEGRQTLRLAQRVGEDDARPPRVLVGPPPGVDLRRDVGRIGPAVDRQAERRLRDEDVGHHRLEGVAGGVGGGLVVTGHDPHHPAVLEPHLHRTEHVAGRHERHAHTVARQRLPAAQAVDRGPGAEARAEHEFSRRAAQVTVAPGARVVGMGVGDDRPRHAPPGIDVEVTGGAVQPRLGDLEKVLHAGPTPPPSLRPPRPPDHGGRPLPAW